MPGTGPVRRPTAAFTDNAPAAHFVCRHVHLKLAVEPARSPITAALPQRRADSGVRGPRRRPARRRSPASRGDRAGGHLAFVYAHADGSVDASAIPNGSALGCAGLVNAAGNVLAIMPHPERDAWNFNHLDRREGSDVLAPSGGAVLFQSFVAAVTAR